MEKALRFIKPDNRIMTGYTAAFFLLLLSCLITLYANQQLIREVKRVTHTYQVILNLEYLLSKVRSAETGLRGYMLTKNPDFLEPYLHANSDIRSLHKALVLETADNPLQQYRLKNLNDLLTKRFEILKQTLSSFEQAGKQISDSLLLILPDSKKTMDELVEMIHTMQEHEDNLLTQQRTQLSQTFAALNTIIIVSLIIAFSLLAFGFLTYMRENKARGKAVQRIKDYQSELNNRIVELAKANTELLQMRRLEKFVATGRIARTIAHEVRNPLTNINLAADQLKTEWANGNGEANMLFDMIGRNSNRINQLISDLLNSTKFSELNYVKHSINAILDEALELAKDRISLDNIQIVKKYSKDICDVTVDKEKIKIAFLNIIVNAIEAMKDKDGQGVLTIKTKAERGKCKVVISDNGPGMDEDTMAKLFEPYFTTKVNGNGLGLANTQNIILNHKGDINVLSSRGRGSMFTITLDFAS